MARKSAVLESTDPPIDSPESAEAVAVQSEAPPAPPPVVPVPSSITTLKERLAQTKDDKAEWRSRGISRYIELIFRSDNPEPDDASDLAAIMEDFGFTVSLFEADAEIVRQAKIHTERFSERAAANAAIVALRIEETELKRRHKEEMLAFIKRWNREFSRQGMATSSYGELVNLARRKPEFFDSSVLPPRLLTPEYITSRAQQAQPATSAGPPISAGDRLLFGKLHPAKLLPSKDGTAEAA